MYKASFYPGPSRVYSKVTEYIYDAYREGILSINHRSKEFAELMVDLKAQLHYKLDIPSDYEIVFASSATECWEMIAQSLIKNSSYHIYNGAFGEKWKAYASRIVEDTSRHEFDFQSELDVTGIDLPENAECLCITHNETSNGTQLSLETISKLRSKYPEQLIAVDATSSMAGVVLDFSLADVWFASVQKCFGLPAGLAVMILSPSAVAKAEEINDTSRYNSLNFVIENYRKNQAPYTPNVLNLYLLNRSMNKNKRIGKIEDKTEARYQEWCSHIGSLEGIELMIKNDAVRSKTVLCIEGEKELVKELMRDAKSNGIIVGHGYGQWKETTFRIANFPAIKSREIADFQKFLSRKYS
ncbi:MAG: aminotransferase class V-fold PLP-dependent enzyme [Bacteroidota bacterium]